MATCLNKLQPLLTLLYHIMNTAILVSLLISSVQLAKIVFDDFKDFQVEYLTESDSEDWNDSLFIPKSDRLFDDSFVLGITRSLDELDEEIVDI